MKKGFTCMKTITRWNNIIYIHNHKLVVCQTEAFQGRHKLTYHLKYLFLCLTISFLNFFLFQNLWTCCARCVEQFNWNKVQLESVLLWITFSCLLVLISNLCPVWHAILYFKKGISLILLNLNFDPAFHVIETFWSDAVPMALFWWYFDYHIQHSL